MPWTLEIEELCIPITEIAQEKEDWVAKAILIEKTAPRISKDGSTTFQKYLFLDKEKSTIQAVSYTRDIQALDQALVLYSTYYIGNAKVEPITIENFRYCTSPFQLTLTRGTFIKEADQENQYPIDQCYNFTPFRDFYKYMDTNTNPITLLCTVIGALPRRFIARQRGDYPIQEFIILNQEQKPMILTMWPKFIDIEAQYLLRILNQSPTLIITRAKVTSVHVLSVETQTMSAILFDPQIPQALELKSWTKASRPYIEQVLAKKLYDATHQTVQPPPEEHMHDISYALNTPYLAKPFWIKAKAKIVQPQHRLYILTCPASNCKKQTGAQANFNFLCRHCNMTFAKPLPRLKFLVQLSDTTGTITAQIEDQHAQHILNISAEDILYMTLKNQIPDIADINIKLHMSTFRFQVRKFTHPLQNTIVAKYNILACLPIEDPTQTPAPATNEASSSNLPDQQIATEDSSKDTTNPTIAQATATKKRDPPATITDQPKHQIID
nr:replication protein A 70 kDa DNA-binding subunit B-like [Coffea arabica]